MPNLDGGHYFLTVLAPISEESTIDRITGRSRSHRQLLQQELALLDTGQQTAASPPDAPLSPFAGNTLNHFVRFAIIDAPNFNGRISGDTLVSHVKGINPLTPQPVDRLGSPFLLFAADIDAPGDGAAALRAYTDRLWATMEAQLGKIFSHCVGFTGVATADAFHDYITRCQVETTMPFNDYWVDGLKAPDSILKRAAIGGGVAVAVVAALSGNLMPIVVVAALVLYALYRTILWQGMKPFPTAPECYLPSVLKSLFVQQNFTRFASEAQGFSEAELYNRFGAFLQAVRPSEAGPTQPPGVVRASTTGW